MLFIGIAFALVANQISPRGLALTRNYFPGESRAAGCAAGWSGAGGPSLQLPGAQPGRVAGGAIEGNKGCN